MFRTRGQFRLRFRVRLRRIRDRRRKTRYPRSGRQVLELLRNDRVRGFRIDVETDSSIEMDASSQNEQRTEFLSSAGAFLNNVLPVIQNAPAMAPAISQMMLFAIRSYRSGRTLETAFEEAADALQQQLDQAQEQQQQPPPPDPKLEAEAAAIQQTAQIAAQKAQAETQQAQQDSIMQGQKAQADMQTAQQKNEVEAQKGQIELQRANIDLKKAEIELQIKQTQAQQAAMPQPVVPGPGGGGMM